MRCIDGVVDSELIQRVLPECSAEGFPLEVLGLRGKGGDQTLLFLRLQASVRVRVCRGVLCVRC